MWRLKARSGKQMIWKLNSRKKVSCLRICVRYIGVFTRAFWFLGSTLQGPIFTNNLWNLELSFTKERTVEKYWIYIYFRHPSADSGSGRHPQFCIPETDAVSVTGKLRNLWVDSSLNKLGKERVGNDQCEDRAKRRAYLSPAECRGEPRGTARFDHSPTAPLFSRFRREKPMDMQW